MQQPYFLPLSLEIQRRLDPSLQKQSQKDLEPAAFLPADAMALLPLSIQQLPQAGTKIARLDLAKDAQ